MSRWDEDYGSHTETDAGSYARAVTEPDPGDYDPSDYGTSDATADDQARRARVAAFWGDAA